jgi:hypothetical protein
LSNALDFLQGQLKELLFTDNIEVAADSGVLACEAFDLGVGEVSAESHIEFTGEVVVELREELDI